MIRVVRVMKKKVLYISNIEVPYRVRFLNELARECDLTVLYEREKSSNRNAEWTQSEERSYRIKYLKGFKVGAENAFSFGILKEVFSIYDCIIVGCYNSPVQMMAMLAMRLFRKKFIINLDGEPFLGTGIKSKLKTFFLKGADQYLVAGEKTAQTLQPHVKNRKIIAYPFSSLTEEEVLDHAGQAGAERRNDTILVVGQYFDYKGMDVALEAARLEPTLSYVFVGMGGRTELFRQEHEIPHNVELIPFLQKQELEVYYRRCAMLVLPSRQECWGLVVNEAASFGMPIVSTWGSGAATEFLADVYPQYLAKPDDAAQLLGCVKTLLASADQDVYSRYLLEQSRRYTIEKCVEAHLAAIADQV